MRSLKTLRLVRHGLLGAGIIAILTWIGFAFHLNALFASSLYLIAVTLLSLLGDFYIAAAISVFAFTCLDYFFVPPVYSFRVDDPSNGISLLSFLGTALVITKLVSRVRAEAKEARLQRGRLEQLHQLFRKLLEFEPSGLAPTEFLSVFLGTFGVKAVSYFNVETAELKSIGVSRHELGKKTRDAFVIGSDADDDENGVVVRHLQVAGEIVAVIGFEGLQESRLTAGPLTAVVVTFLERMRAFRVASEAAAASQAEIYRSAILDALAHEFKTPLATILAAAGGLREAGPLLNQQVELADIVEGEAARLGGLTSRLLRTARLDQETVRPHLELTDVVFLASSLAGQYAARSADRRILFHAIAQTETVADPELLRLVLGQLIENACQYSPAGSTITIRAEEDDDFVAIRVSNDGSHIPISERRHVFERFFRGADAKRSTSGSGLGLYVARKIAHAHGGALELESDGTQNDPVTFCLKIPKVKNDANHAAAAK